MKVVLSQFQGVDCTPGLPLAAGCLVATARADPLLGQAEFGIEVDRVEIDRVVRGFDRPDVLGFSLYPWNAAYSLAVLREARRAWPDALILAGGPSVPKTPEASRRFLADHPEIDAAAFSEGELAFTGILRAHAGHGALDDVGGIGFRRGGEVVLTTAPARIRDMTPTASPYLDGTFDELVAGEGRARFAMALMETNRGCPFTCTFCDWSLTRHVVEFPLDRVEAEIEWIARHGFKHVCICDANFGMRPRDHDIARVVAASKHAHGSPTYCYFYLTKNNHRRNLTTIEILHEAGIGCCVALAIQDFDEDVLDAVRRGNIQSGESHKLREICAERGIATLNELILGLPRQTPESFARTLDEAMAPAPGHTFVAFLCHLIPDTELGSAVSRERYGIETRRCRWLPTQGADAVVEEVMELVVATKDLPPDAWRRAYGVMQLASAGYNLRLLRVVLQYLAAVGADRAAYVLRLADAVAAADPGTVLGAIAAALDRHTASILSGGPVSIPPPGGGAPLPPDEAVAMIALEDPDGFYTEVRAVTEAFLGEDLGELFAFQSAVVPRFGAGEPVALDLARDWPAFAATGAVAPPVARPVRMEFHPPAHALAPEFTLFATTHLACVRAYVSTGELVVLDTAGAAV